MNNLKLNHLILNSEEILMDKILGYAKEHNYVKYTSTLKEAWRLSISGLSEAILRISEKSSEIPEMSPDVVYEENEVAEFGIIEARKHRSRGVTLSLFLGLMKYYHQSYTDLIQESNFTLKEKEYYTQYIKRVFDYIELGFINEWAGLSEKQKIDELQQANRNITNEKTKYLTVFESIYDPIILIDKDNNIENINNKAAEVFFDSAAVGIRYYGKSNSETELGWLKEELASFLSLNRKDILIEKTLSTKEGQKTFLIKFKKMLDISEKYRGTVIIFYDISDRIKIEKELLLQHEKLKYYAFTDPMTGVSNRRTGLMTLERELDAAAKQNRPLTVCFLDVDGLKAVNDTYGHSEGDFLLNYITASIKSLIGKNDSVSRMGGDEFLVIFPGCTEPDAGRIIGNIYSALETYNQSGKKPYPVSFSYGMVEVSGGCTLHVSDVIKAADEKMYRNKLSKRMHTDR